MIFEDSKPSLKVGAQKGRKEGL